MDDAKRSPYRVLIVDHSKETRENLKSLIANEPDLVVVGEAADGLDAVEQAERLQPDVISMNISMAKMDGIAATAEIRSRLPGAKIVIVTIHGDNEYIRAAMRAGAVFYLVMPVTREEYTETLRQCAARA